MQVLVDEFGFLFVDQSRNKGLNRRKNVCTAYFFRIVELFANKFVTIQAECRVKCWVF